MSKNLFLEDKIQNKHTQAYYCNIQYLICTTILWEKTQQMEISPPVWQRATLHSDLGKKPVNNVVASGFMLQIICRYLTLIIV